MKNRKQIKIAGARLLLLAAAAITLALAGTVNLAWAAKPPKPPPPPPQPTASYTYLYLGGLGGSDGYAYAINNAGQVVGDSLTTAGIKHAFIVVPQDLDGDGEPDLWNATGTTHGLNPLMIDLGMPTGIASASQTYAVDINELGQVVGPCAGTDSSRLGAWVVAPVHANGDGQPDTWYQNDGTGANSLMTPIRFGGAYDDATAEIYAINNLGQIVGTCSGVGFLLNSLDLSKDGRADTWYIDANLDGVNDLLVDLGGAFDSLGNLVRLQPLDLNDAGQIVGYIGYTPFLLTPKQTDAGPVWAEDLNGDGENDLIVRLPMPLTGSVSYAPLVVNSQGSIAGNFRTSKGTYHAILWRTDAQGVLQYADLGVPDKETNIRSQGINDRDQVVGDAYGGRSSFNWSGWLWDNGVMSDVRMLMDKSAELTDCYMFTAGINNASLMTGFAGGGPGYYPWIAVPVR